MRRLLWLIAIALSLGGLALVAVYTAREEAPTVALPATASQLTVVQGARRVVITDATTIENTLTLLRSAARLDQEPPAVVSMTLAYATSTGESMELAVYGDTARAEPGLWLRGPAIFSLQTMLEERLKEAAVLPLITRYIEGHDQVLLVAQDRGIEQRLTPAQQAQLAAHLRSMSQIDLGSPGAGPQYPNVMLRLEGAAESEIEVRTPQYARVGRDQYAVPPQLWRDIIQWLPPEAKSPESLSFLFRATALHLAVDLGDANRPWWNEGSMDGADNPGALIRAHQIVRLLRQGSPSTRLELTPEIGHLTFTVGGKAETVTLGQDWLRYRDQLFDMPDLPQRLRFILHAN